MQANLVGRVVLGIAVVAAAVLLLIVLQEDDSGDDGSSGTTVAEQTSPKPNDSGAPSSEPSIPTIVIQGGQPVAGVEELTFEAGDRVRFAVRSDTSDEVHVHGYDIEEEVGPGRVAKFDFPASIEGVFEAELHGSGEQIAELRIEP